MSGVLRLANTGGSNGRSTIVAAASTDATFTLPPTGGTLLTTSFDTIGDITWNGSNINITNADLNVNSGQLFVDESTGFVGIGTTTPNYKLQIRNTIAGTDPGHLFLQNVSSTLGTEASIIFSPNLVGDVIRSAKIKGINKGGNATDLAFYTNGNAQTPDERVRIDSAGRVGIGTPSPGNFDSASNQLVIQNSVSCGITIGATSSTNSNIYFADGDQGNERYRGTITYSHSVDAMRFGTGGGNEAMRIDSSGNVGINLTPSGNSKLQIAGSMRFADGGNPSDSVNPVIYRVSGQDSLAFASGNNERMRMDSAGRLLVGTSASLFGTGNVQCGNTGGNNFTGIRYSTGAGGAQLVLGHSQSGTIGSNVLLANNDYIGSIEFRGADGANYLVGASIDARIDGTPGTNDMPSRLVFNTTADGASSPTERMRISSNGIVSLTQNQARFALSTQTGLLVPLTIQNSGNNTQATLVEFTGWNGTVIGSITGFVNQTNYATSSDHRLKENVVSLSNGIDRVKQLQPKRFNFIENPDLSLDGFLAHEAQQIVPNAVTGEHNEIDQEGKPVYQGIDQSKLVPLLTAALQETIAKVEALEAEVSKLRSN